MQKEVEQLTIHSIQSVRQVFSDIKYMLRQTGIAQNQ